MAFDFHSVRFFNPFKRNEAKNGHLSRQHHLQRVGHDDLSIQNTNVYSIHIAKLRGSQFYCYVL